MAATIISNARGPGVGERAGDTKKHTVGAHLGRAFVNGPFLEATLKGLHRDRGTGFKNSPLKEKPTCLERNPR